MKRIITIILTIMMLLSLASCGTGGNPDPSPAPTGEAGVSSSVPTAAPIVSPTDKPEETPGESTDFPAADMNSLFANFDKELVCDTEDSFYYLRSIRSLQGTPISIVYVTDKEYRDWMPLCGRPDCMHDNSNCNARLEGFAYGKIWRFGEHIYYVFLGDEGVENPELWRMKLDGSDHEKLLELSRPDPNADGSWSWNWTFHNKYLIVDYKNLNVSFGASITNYIVDLSAKKLEQKRLDAVLDTGEKTHVGFCFAGRGSMVYHVQNEVGETIADPDLGTERTRIISTLYKTDLETGATVKLCVLPFQPFGGDCSLEGDLLYFCGSDTEYRIVSVNTETGELTHINSAELYSVRWYTPYKGYILGTTTNFSTKPDMTPLDLTGTDIYSLSGELLYNIPYEDYNADISILFVIGDYVFGVERTQLIENPTYLLPTWYLNISDIGTDNLMWRKWAPEG